MVVLTLLVTLGAIGIIALSGPVYLVVRDTVLAKYSAELSILLLPIAVVVVGSAAGYRHARATNGWVMLVVLGLGAVTTIIVGVRGRVVLRNALKNEMSRFAFLAGLALIAGLLVLPRHVAENELGYLEYMNGEFLNYSQLASTAMQQVHSPLPLAWAIHHQDGRDGIDFLNAALAMMTDSRPTDTVQLASAFLRVAYLLTCGLLIWSSRRKGTVGAILAGMTVFSLACYNLDIYHFQTSFMAGNAALPVFVASMWLVAFAGVLPLSRFLPIYWMGNIYLLVTYPEVLPFLKIVETFVCAEALVKASRRAWLRALVLGNLVVLLSNPMLVWQKVGYLKNLLAGGGGWNLLGSPVDNTATYLNRLVGLEYAFAGNSQVPPWASAVIFSLFSVVAVWALAALARRLNTRAVWLVPVGVIWFHLTPLLNPGESDYKMFYGATKFVLLWLWIVPVAIAVAAAEINPRRSLISVGTVLVVVVAVNLPALRSAIAFQLRLPTFYPAKLADRMLNAVTTAHRRPAILSEQNIPLWYWFQVFDTAGIEPILLSQQQVKTISRAPQAEAELLRGVTPGEAVAAITPTKVLWFQNNNIIEVDEAASEFVERLAASVHVDLGPSILSAPPVRLHRAILTPNSDAK